MLQTDPEKLLAQMRQRLHAAALCEREGNSESAMMYGACAANKLAQAVFIQRKVIALPKRAA